MTVPWLVSDIDPLESETLTYLSWLAGNDVAAAAKVVGYPWFVDGIGTGDEALGLRTVARLSTLSPAVTHELLDLPWLSNRLGTSESAVIWTIFALASQESESRSFALSRHVLGLPWVRDGVSKEEGRKLDYFICLPVAANAQESRQAGNGEFEALESIQSLDPEREALDEGVLLALDELDPGHLARRGWDTGLYLPGAHLAGKPWFRDGLSHDEKALIASLRIILRAPQTDAAVRILRQLIDHGAVLSETMTTRSGGKLDVYVVSRKLIPSGQEIFGKLRAQVSSPSGVVSDTSLNAVSVILVDPELRPVIPKFWLAP